MSNKGALIEFQVSIRGRGVQALDHELATELVRDTVNGIRPPRGVRVEIIAWRSGVKLDWRSDTNEWLRELLRGQLQQGRIEFSLRSR